MRVLQINEFCGQGSTGRLVQELNEGLISNGHTSVVYYATGTSEYEYSYKIGNRLDQLTHAVLSRITGMQGYFSSKATRKLLNNIDKFNPEIIHLHNLHGNFINLKMLFEYTANKKIPVIITLHDCWFFTGKCTHFIEANCYKWRNVCNKCPQLHSDNVNPTLFLDRSKRCFIDKQSWFRKQQNFGIVGVSEWIANEARYSILKDGLIEFIPNWIDTGIFKISDLDFQIDGIDDKKIVLMVSTNISEIKGYNEMLYLAEHLPLYYKIVLVGNNTDKLYIPSNVIHINKIEDKKELAGLYSCSDVCVNTTKYESFGMVSIESMACGTPIIVYDNTASAHIVPDGCGYVVKQDEGYQAVLNAVIEVCEGKKLIPRSEISNVIHEKYNLNTSLKKYIQFYEKLISEK